MNIKDISFPVHLSHTNKESGVRYVLFETLLLYKTPHMTCTNTLVTFAVWMKIGSDELNKREAGADTTHWSLHVVTEIVA